MLSGLVPATATGICMSGRGSGLFFFRVQLETRVGKEWLPVVRYDTAHGFAHRDLLDHKGRAQKTPLFNQDLNDALTFAENDLKTNWLSYKRGFMEEI